MNIKQYHIDNGLMGGFVTTVLGSLFILGPINTIILFSIKFENDPNKILYIIISLIAYIFWAWFYFAVFVPSQITFSNRQGTVHKNPTYIEIIKLNEKVDELTYLLKDNIILLKK